jgi:dihydrofolate reductase
MTRLHLIYARARNGVIGRGGAMPWHLPEDLAHFKQVTMGASVIMGRKTWESLPPRFRPLPGRRNIVISRQVGLELPGAVVVSSLDDAVRSCANEQDAWVMGGAEIYALAAPLADTAEITEIDAEYEGDAFAPALGAEWVEVRRESHESAAGISYSFTTWRNTRRGV